MAGIGGLTCLPILTHILPIFPSGKVFTIVMAELNLDLSPKANQRQVSIIFVTKIKDEAQWRDLKLLGFELTGAIE